MTNLATFNCKIFLNNLQFVNIQFTQKNNTNHPSSSLLKILKHHNIPINYQCKSGYCGSCRILLTKGNIQYYKEPLAFLFNPKEILTCCCVPIADIVLKII